MGNDITVYPFSDNRELQLRPYRQIYKNYLAINKKVKKIPCCNRRMPLVMLFLTYQTQCNKLILIAFTVRNKQDCRHDQGQYIGHINGQPDTVQTQENRQEKY